ncbi:FG-GAP repeat domain-containing protein [Enhygromyxa salina]|uniref:FG-GAP repeat protein n=1 Tax=Enhygromyxa salina TaxID=215803 RepID=A0A2S9XTW7_9BACT|nr:VCBS repeat-containing protein [Enhygromyxa salina]PRP96170.1 FG-GAP repeat protein [Enhygromyxa salina]
MPRALSLPLAVILTSSVACFSDPLADDGRVSSSTSSTSDSGSTTDDPTTSDSDTSDSTTSDTDTSDTDTSDDTTDPGCQDPVCYEPGVDFGAGFGPEAVIVADIDGDGVSDIVTANAEGDNIAVLRGLGGGDFAAPSFYAAGDDPVTLAAVNLDPQAPGDGGIDIVVGNRAGQSMSVLINTGNNVAFGPPEIEPIGVGLVDLDTGNFTLDSDFESVVGAIGDQGMLITHGTGLGIAGDLDAAPTTEPSVAVTAGFLTQDAYSDFISLSNVAPALTVVHFIAEEPYLDIFDLLIADAGDDLALASLNADPNLDLVIASRALEIITVFPGDGNGMFGAATAISIDAGADSLAVGDVDDDGKVDVVFSASAVDEVGLMFGNGDTSLALPVYFDVGMRPMAVALADFNADGQLDIVTANADANNVTVLLSAIP